MTNIEFSSELKINKFISRNYYTYDAITGLGIFYDKETKNLPMIVHGGSMRADELVYANCSQFQGRSVSMAKIAEVANSSYIPLKLNYQGEKYLIAKGFIAKYSGIPDDCQILFLATADKSPTDIKEVKFYVCRDVYKAENKKIFPIIKEFMVKHTGDVIITAYINIGGKWLVPVFKTLTERKTYCDILVKSCIAITKKKYEPKKSQTGQVLESWGIYCDDNGTWNNLPVGTDPRYPWVDGSNRTWPGTLVGLDNLPVRLPDGYDTEYYWRDDNNIMHPGIKYNIGYPLNDGLIPTLVTIPTPDYLTQSDALQMGTITTTAVTQAEIVANLTTALGQEEISEDDDSDYDLYDEREESLDERF